MTAGPPIGIYVDATSREAPAAAALAAAMPGARLVSAGWRFGRDGPAGQETAPAALDAWLTGAVLHPARKAAASAAGPRPARASSLPSGATLIVCGLEPWTGALPRLLARRPDLRVVALSEAAVRQWPEFYPETAPAALAAMASRAALVVASHMEGEASLHAEPSALLEERPSRLAGTAPGAPGAAVPASPYVVACGPIEARANTLLLLHLWRNGMARRATLPKLVLAGNRGSQVEEIAPLLDWNAALRPLVAEAPGLPPTALRRLLEGARAVLVPDFAGPPACLMRDLAALGVPMIAADTAIARRLGVPCLDPLDGPGWHAAIAATAARPSTLREDPPQLPDWPAFAARLLAAIRALP